MARWNEVDPEIEARNTLAQLTHDRDAAKRALSRYRRILGSLIPLIFVGLNNVFWGYYTYPDVDPNNIIRTKSDFGGEDVRTIVTGDGLATGLLVTGYILTIGALLVTLAVIGRYWDKDLVEDVHEAQLHYEQQLNRM